MPFFDKASKTNTIFSFCNNIYFVGSLIGGGAWLGGSLGWDSPIVTVLGKPLAAIVGMILVLLLVAVIKKVFFEEKSTKQITQVAPIESYLEIIIVNSTKTLSSSTNISVSWGFDDITGIGNGFSRATCFVQFEIPYSISDNLAVSINAKNGEIFLQEQLGILEHNYVFINDKIYGALVVVHGNISAINGKYVISFKKKSKLSQH